jgi:hypothetical protein
MLAFMKRFLALIAVAAGFLAATPAQAGAYLHLDKACGANRGQTVGYPTFTTYQNAINRSYRQLLTNSAGYEGRVWYGHVGYNSYRIADNMVACKITLVTVPGVSPAYIYYTVVAKGSDSSFSWYSVRLDGWE